MAITGNDAVFGHYMQQGAGWQPLLAESSGLFANVVSDQLGAVEAQVEADESKLSQFYLVLYWSAAENGAPRTEEQQQPPVEGGSKTAVTVKHRTLLMLAAYHGSLRVLSYLLSKGAEVSRKSPEGLNAYDFAASSELPCAPTMLAMLKDADMPLKSTSGDFGAELDARLGSQDLDCDPFNSSSSMFNTSDLTRPEYSTDNFRMFCFKVLRCSKRHAHDWRSCPFAHPTENARRRDPREFKYCAVACPDYKQGFCIRGDICPYSHGVFECWLHPSRYRTQLCKDGVNCQRPVCFFAHSLPELRAPTYTWVPTPEDVTRIGAQANQQAQQNGGASNSQQQQQQQQQQLQQGGMGTATGSLMDAAAGIIMQQQQQQQHGVDQMGLQGMAMTMGMGAGMPNNFGKLQHELANGNGTHHQGSLSAVPTPPGQNSPRIARHLSDPLASCSNNQSQPVRHMVTFGQLNGNGHIEGDHSVPTQSASGADGCGSGNNSGTSSNGSGVSHATTRSGLQSPSSGATSPLDKGSGSLSHSSSSQCSSANQNGRKEAAVAAAAAQAQVDVKAAAAQMVAAAAAAAANNSNGKAVGSMQNLTQTSPGTSLLGFTAPRMSNAFARRHGLNPKDNPMLNLQKIAIQSQQDNQRKGPQMQMPSGMQMPMTRAMRHQMGAQAFAQHTANNFNQSMQMQRNGGNANGGGMQFGGANGGYGAGPAAGAGASDPNLLAAQLAQLNMHSGPAAMQQGMMMMAAGAAQMAAGQRQAAVQQGMMMMGGMGGMAGAANGGGGGGAGSGPGGGNGFPGVPGLNGLGAQMGMHHHPTSAGFSTAGLHMGHGFMPLAHSQNFDQ